MGAPKAVPPRAGRILVIDDEPDHRTTLQGILERSAGSVEAYGDPAQALEALERHPFDVAICDLRLPGSDGLQVMAELLARQPGLPVVILTAYPSSATCADALGRGAAAYLEKPFAPEALRALISALLAGEAAATS